MTVSRPLPGIRFEPQARPLSDALPRMDIPIFVGFAASGPLHTPVAIEDAAQFAMLFGPDVELPRPRGSRDPRYAHVASSVRAFFRNGGRRCWIVRVAAPHALWHRFVVPGLMKVTPDGATEPAWIHARSQGSWSEALRVQTNLVAEPLPFVSLNFAATTAQGTIAPTAEVRAGDLIRYSWIDSELSLYLFVTSSKRDRSGATIEGRPLWVRTIVSSPPDQNDRFEVAATVSAAPAGTPAVERVTFDLTVRREDAPPFRFSRLGFLPDHPRYCGALPADISLFEDSAQFAAGASPPFTPTKRMTFSPTFIGSTNAPDSGWSELWREASSPRFPLAFYGVDSGTPADRFGGTVYAPIGMSVLLSSEQSAERVNSTSLERDGLDVFGGDLFTDSRLRDTSVRDLLDRADALRYQAEVALTGMHAALGIEEATLLTVPDAVHSGWEPEREASLESPPESSPLAHPELWRWADCHSPQPTKPPKIIAGFVDCDAIEPIAPPSLSVTPISAASYRITWDPIAGTTDELQEATRPDFSDASVIALGAAGEVTLYGRPAGDYFYRIRRLRGARTSDWSAPLAKRVGGATGFVSLEEIGDSLHLRPIHEAMVRMAAARADLVAVLSLPRHYDEQRALAHMAALTGALEQNALSYGALWHPWLIVRDEDAAPLQETPPDGAITGVIAARASARGAWVAPANEPLRDVLGLIPTIPATARQSLQDAAVNLIRQEPAGIVCLDADTLSYDPDVRPLNVRRLLILVRRAALRIGNEYAFENSFALRNTLKRGFESLLTTMFARGAFTGRNAGSAFQVITDETVNTPQAVDQGRLIADLRIAPSRPLSFMTIRLLQRGDTSAAVEVR